MSTINYERLVSELIKPLVTHPDDVVTELSTKDDTHYTVKVRVHKDDLGRVIGKKGRVANAIRTIAHAASTRNQEFLDIELEELA